MPLLGFAATAELLTRYAIPTCHQVAVRSADQLWTAKSSFEYPVVLKALSQQTSHKTEKGLVKVGINSDTQLREAFQELSDATLNEHVDVFLLQQQLSGVELIVGGKRDPTFGPTVLFGLGGIMVELVQDASVRVAPFSFDEARRMMMETKAAAFFTPDGFRGRKLNSGVVESLLMSVGKLLVEHPEIAELDFNPVIATADGAYVVDARVVTD
ncbi:Acetate--CoA ligase [ADP-forming] I subunit beta [uncultured archaeon]|nr:Acetate--CoA ligase [ADP-forming] I subunit beta [uncultured archaeon]